LFSVVTVLLAVGGDGLSHVSAPQDESSAQVGAAANVGNQICVLCHKAEVASMKQADNVHGRSLARFLSVHKDRNAKILGNLEDSDTWADGERCHDCHGMEVTTWVGGRAVETKEGIGCESCHGPAGEAGARPAEGRPKGWLNPHSSYGLGVFERRKESPEHKRMRRERSAKAHMRTATGAGMYDLAVRCYDCHFIADDELTDDGGHRVGHGADLELFSWGAGWGRHNFLVSSETDLRKPVNASVSSLVLDEMGGAPDVVTKARVRTLFLVGQLARLETGLRVLVAKREGSAFDNAWDQLVEPVKDLLEELVEEDGVIAACPRLETVWEAVEDAEDWKDEIEEQESLDALRAAADVAAREGRALAAEGVSADEALETLNERVEENEVKGEAWQAR